PENSVGVRWRPGGSLSKNLPPRSPRPTLVPVRALLVTFIAATALASPRVEVRRGSVWVDGGRAWRGSVPSPLVWSASCGAVASAGAHGAGRATFVVLLTAGPTVITWPLPQPARAVFWLGPTRVGAGASVLEPRAVGSFTVSAP